MRAFVRLLILVLLLAAMGMGYLAFSSYFGQYCFVAATRGAHNEAEHRQHLMRALSFDPSLGYANILLARVHVRRGYYGAALPCQQDGMRSFNSVGSFKQLGTIHDRLGHSDQAREAFERVLRMHPRDIEGLERLAKIAFEAGNHEQVAELTAAILRLDMVNTNAYYLRARDAELVSNWSAAYMNYQQVAAILSRQPAPAGRAFFDPGQVATRMREIGKLIAQR